MARLDPEGLALRVVLRLDEILAESREGCEALARRASELPQLLGQAGLIQASLFYMSKSDVGIFSSLMDFLHGKATSVDLKDECKGEGKGYTIALAILAAALEEMGKTGTLADASRTCSEISGLRELAKCLREIRDKRLELRVEALLEPYLIAVKRLAEALYKGRQRAG